MSWLFKQIKVLEEKLVCIRILLDPSAFPAWSVLIHMMSWSFLSLLQMKEPVFIYL